MSKAKSQEGQASVEFILSFVFVLGILFLFVSLAINATTGYLAHYATFMTSRTYLSYDSAKPPMQSAADAESYSRRNVFSRYQVDRMVEEPVLKFNSPFSNAAFEFVGAYFEFKRPFSLLSILGGGTNLNYLSESFLGKEETRQGCREQICRALFNTDCNSAGDPDLSVHSTLYDNGC